MKIKIIFISLILIFSYQAGFAEEELKRTILALFDSTEELNRREDNNLIHNNIEVILNYLGFKVIYWDINRGLPREEDLKNVGGVITYFQDGVMPRASDYCFWVKRQIEEGRKFVILGNMGAFVDKHSGRLPRDKVNLVFSSLGLEYKGEGIDNPLFIEIVKKDNKAVGFEKKPEPENYEWIISRNKNNKVYLTLRRKDIPASESSAVIVTPQGGFALEGYVLFREHFFDKYRWILNPFLFFSKSFAAEETPHPDTTTLLGRRIFYSHIDGDGFRNLSLKKKFCGEIIKEEILKKYNLPITVSFIAADIDKRYFGNSLFLKMAKEIASLPNVEIGAHGYSHPLDWQRKITAYSLADYSQSLKEKQDIASESDYKDYATVLVSEEEYLKTEIDKAVDFINKNIAPANKKVVIYQWTGDCLPPPEALERVNNLGLENINGGDSRFDRAYPSYTSLAPLSRPLGGKRQIYTSNANENIYTNKWSGPFYGLKQVIETFKQTEIPTLADKTPRRISPLNIYCHFYSAEKNASLKALKEVYDYCLSQNIIPIFTSYYTKIVKGFFSLRIIKISNKAWKFSHYGNLGQIRFDNVDYYPDLSRSRNILGFKFWKGHLYVHLKKAEEAILYLTDKKPSLAYLEEASSLPEDFYLTKSRVSFSTSGFGKGIYKFKNMQANSKYKVLVYGKGGIIYKNIFPSDKDGALTIEFPLNNNVKKVKVEIKIVKEKRNLKQNTT